MKQAIKNNNCLVLFSLDTNIKELQNNIARISTKNILLLSSHHLLDLERNKLTSACKNILFFDFSDFISEKEMVFCDEKADLMIVDKYGSRLRHLPEYFDTIKTLKNQLVLENFKKKHLFDEGLILNNTLGISANVWKTAGLVARYKEKLETEENVSSFCCQLFRKIKAAVKLFLPSDTVISCCKNTKTNEEYYLFGRYSRLAQYFSDYTVVRPLNIFHVLLLKLLINNIESLTLKMPGVIRRILLWYRKLILKLTPKKFSYKIFIVPVHELNEVYGKVAELLSSKIWGIQDGYLPGNYTSCYMKYFTEVSGYFTWDNVSGEHFNMHKIQNKTTSILSKKTIKKLPLTSLKIKKVLILCSGAGDWTALKNRSDEDYMFEMFVNAAKKLPSVEFTYRPHPLWVYPTHQGRASIRRLEKYSKELNLNNFHISLNVRGESEIGYTDSNFSVRYSSIEKEISDSDIIFGDHSQAVINAAATGTVFASINATKRRSFFDNINRYGFKCCKKSSEIVDYINNLSNNVDAVNDYNTAVERYNFSEEVAKQ